MHSTKNGSLDLFFFQSVPYHVPDWLPETITLLARYGNSKAPDTVRVSH